MQDLGILDGFYTSSYVKQKWIQELLTRSGNKFFTRRFREGLSGEIVHPHWRFELKEILYARIYGNVPKTQHAVYDRDAKFDQYMAQKLPHLSGDIFWGFQGSCLHSLRSALQAGKKAVVELATAHVTAAKIILGEEQKLHPEWADSFDNLEFPAPYEKRLREEPHQADVVIAASKFTRQTLLDDGVGEGKIKYLPLGFEIDYIPYHKKEFKSRKRPLRLLYVGRITQRKGIKYLLEAMKGFDKSEVELHIIGFVHGNGDALKEYAGLFTLHPPLQQYELFKKYAEYDALVLPSVFEGFGLVILEAMAAGLPVITTPNTMGPELIVNDENGYIVPIRDIDSIKVAIQNLLNKNEEERMVMADGAHNAALQYSWDAYAANLAVLLNEF